MTNPTRKLNLNNSQFVGCLIGKHTKYFKINTIKVFFSNGLHFSRKLVVNLCLGLALALYGIYQWLAGNPNKLQS